MRFPSMRARVRALSLYASALLLGFLSLGFLAQGSKVEGATSAVGAVGLAQLLHEGRQARTAAELARFEAGAAKAAASYASLPRHVACRCAGATGVAGYYDGGLEVKAAGIATEEQALRDTLMYGTRISEVEKLRPMSDYQRDVLKEIERGARERIAERMRIDAGAGRVVQGLVDYPGDSVPPAVFA